MARKEKKSKTIADTVHAEAKRVGIPTEEFADMESGVKPIPLRYPRNIDLDPQLVWKGKDAQDSDDLTVKAMPIYIQEKIHPRTIIEDLLAETTDRARNSGAAQQLDLFSDFNGVPKGVNKMDFYHYEQNWTNRMILGDSLQVMASLAEKENLRGKVQCIYFDPPYGIKFNSNFQWSTTSTNVKDGKDMTQEPEMVKAFRDTWRHGIHSYLSYIRDRLVIARDLLSDSGSIFVQIGDENVHRVRSVMDEVFGAENFSAMISYATTSGNASSGLNRSGDYVLWYARDIQHVKYRQIFIEKSFGGSGTGEYRLLQLQSGERIPITSWETRERRKFDYERMSDSVRVFRLDNLTSSRHAGDGDVKKYSYQGREFSPGNGTYKTSQKGLDNLYRANRIGARANSLAYIRFYDDFMYMGLNNKWDDTAIAGWSEGKVYVCQTARRVIERCILMTTDPGDLVLDPTCGSGTTAYVAEQWGRRWITIDTSRVALALARARLMGARYPYYVLADSPEGQKKEAELSQKLPSTQPTYGDIRQGFVYERVPHITLKSIANNAEIDVIWERHTPKMDAVRAKLGKFEEWEVPREGTDVAKGCDAKLLAEWWKLRRERQAAIDKSIAAKAEFEYLYDKPCTDNSKVRVAGPFTIESLSPYRTMIVDENDDLRDPLVEDNPVEDYKDVQDFAQMILSELRKSGVQQSDRKNRISFDYLEPMPGRYVSAEGRYARGGKMVKAGIFIGPEFGTVARADLVAALREAKMLGLDELISCAFSYEASVGDLEFPGMPLLKARMNADLHMAGELKSTGSGNLFVIFGEPDNEVVREGEMIRVKIKGVDIFNPQTGKVTSSEAKDIACWFVDTEYNEESFFVRQAYFLGQKDPYQALRDTLKAEIDAEAWESIHSEISRPFPVPSTGRIAVKIINHLGDEVMKVFRVR